MIDHLDDQRLRCVEGLCDILTRPGVTLSDHIQNPL
jgi:hypothetical protein